ncbi:MAG: glycosyltransferase family 2 protein [Candidatus Eisenbacteria bacterium]|nr:glycosyltransferase family 2 protein [Candidatus Eisenbacteria bacterium]
MPRALSAELQIQDHLEATLSVIVVSYNCLSLLGECLSSIPAGTGDLDHEVIVVDNASSDGTCVWLRDTHPEVRAIQNATNRGFARACNQGIAEARGEYVLLLNPDTTVDAGTIRKTHDYMLRNPWAAACGCRVLRLDGSLDLSCKRDFPSPWDAFCRMTGLSRLFPGSTVFAGYDARYLDENVMQQVPLIDGCYMMMRRSALSDIGLLDERFFMYAEEMDWCRRAHKRAWSIGYDPSGSIIHNKGEITRKSPFRMLYHFHRSMALYCAKHYCKWNPVLLLVYPGIVARFLALTAVNLIRRDRRVSG